MDTVNTTDTDNFDLFIKKDDLVVAKLGVMAAKIAFYNFQWRYITLVMCLSARNILVLDTFLSGYNQSVVMKIGKFKPRARSVSIPQYVVFGEATSELVEYIRWLLDVQFENTGKFIVICYSVDNEKCDEEYMFKSLAEILIVNVIFIRIEDDEPISFTYHMVLPGKCLNNEPEKLALSNDCVNDTCFKLLYNENFKDLYKCPLVVSTFEQPPFMYLHNGTREPTGGDADILKVVTNTLNATLVIKTPIDDSDWGHYLDKNWTGSMGDIFNRRAHLSVCSLPLTVSKYGNFQISFIYNTMDIVWVAELPALIPPWAKLLHPFNFHARVAIFVMFVFIMLLGGFIRTSTWKEMGRSLKIGYLKHSLFFYSWAIFLGLPILPIPTKRGFLIIMYSWIWFCFVIRSCYQAALISSLKQRMYETPFESFYDVLDKKLEYGGQASYREYFVNDKHIYDNWKQLEFDDAYKMLDKISNGSSSFVLAFNKELVIEHLLNYNGSRRLQIIPRKILNSPAVMYAKKYSPLVAPLNTILSRAVESGYAQAWHMRFASKKKHLFEHSRKRKTEALTLEHFSGSIIVLAAGWTVSILIFIVELVCGKIEIND